MSPNYHFCLTRQRGAALAMAIFIIVVLSLVGLSLVKVLNTATEATVSDVLGTRAEFAAKSAANAFLVTLFDSPNSIDGTACVTRTPGLAPSQVDTNPSSYTYHPDAQGLNQCAAQVFCDTILINQRNHYRIESIAVCEAGDFSYSRNLLIEVSDAVL